MQFLLILVALSATGPYVSTYPEPSKAVCVVQAYGYTHQMKEDRPGLPMYSMCAPVSEHMPPAAASPAK